MMKRLDLPGKLAGFRDVIVDQIRAMRPKAASGTFFPGWEALTYGAAFSDETGMDIGPESAMRCGPVFAAVKVISESFGQVPCHMHAKDEKGGSAGRELAHPVADLLGDVPNPEMTWLEFRQYCQRNVCLHGNAYAWIVRDHRGNPAELYPLAPGQVSITFDPAFPLKPIYIVSGPDGSSYRLHRSDIFHVRTSGQYPFQGDSPIMLNRQAIGIVLVMERHVARLFGRGARPAGVLKTQRQLSAEAIKLLRTSLDSTHGGEGSAQTLVLEEGMDWAQMSMSSVDAQFQELRKQQLYQVCRIWRIPPILMQDETKSIGSSTEALGRQFISYTLAPLFKAWEQALELSLFAPEERRAYYFLHDLSEFTRAESQARWQANVSAVVNGIMTVNEVRSMEALAPVEGGDERRVPVNTAPWQQGAVGQTAHAVNPTPTLLAPLDPENQPHSRLQRPAQADAMRQSRDRLEHFLSRSPERLRLAAPPKGVARPRAGAIDINHDEDSGRAS
jgi:HK97 family phage portal protein